MEKDSREQMREDEFDKWRSDWGFIIHSECECIAKENLRLAYEAIERAATARAYESLMAEVADEDRLTLHDVEGNITYSALWSWLKSKAVAATEETHD